MVSAEDRVLNAMELKDPIDKIPKMELFSSILPFVKVFMNWEALPPRIRLLNRKWRILEESVDSVKEALHMKKFNPKEPHTLYGRLFRKSPLINLITKNFSLAPEPDHEKADKSAIGLATLYAQMPIKLGYDLFCLLPLEWPDFLAGMHQMPDGNSYPATRDGELMDIRSNDLELLPMGITEHDAEKAIQNSKAFFESAQIERFVDIVNRSLNTRYRGKKIKDRVLATVLHNGPFETWLSIFGNHNMQGFYRRVFKEHRNGCQGAYFDLIKLKIKVMCDLIKRLAEIDLKVFAVGDDCATIHGSMLPPKIYRDFIAVHIKTLADAAHRVGMKLLLHTDGKFKVENKETPEEKWEFMNILLNTGIDALHPIEMWANDIEELKREFGQRICLCNGINTIELHKGSRVSVARLTKQILEKVYRGGGNRLNGYMAGSDNTLMAGCQPSLIRQMLYTVDDFGHKILGL